MIPGSSNPLLAFKSAGAGSQYQISRSLRFNSADSANLSRTIGTAGNRKTWTWSGWVKRSAFGALEILFSSGADASNNLRVGFDASNKLFASNEAAGVTTTLRLTTAVYRDPGAWMHIVLAADTTLATAADRVKLYVNGAEVTAFDTNNAPTQNADLNCNNAGTFYVGRNFSANYLNAYLSEIHFVSGLALTPSSFGETDATTGEWIPKSYTGSYGTNGHKLTFSDNSAATAAALGADTSGGGNNFTPNNLSVTAGAGNDSLVETPTSYGTDTGVGGEVRGNYCTWNPISTVTTVTLANGNLDHSSASTGQNALGTIGVSTGKWYWEIVTTAGTTQTRVGVYGTAASTLYSLAANSTIYGIRFDADAGTLDWTSNGTSWTSIATGLTSGPYFPYANNNGTTAKTVSANFGQRPFAYTAPSGFKALCDTNLPAPTIAKPSTVMDTVLYTGTGASLTPTSSLGFSPDLVWIKGRSGATDHAIYDTVRGTTLDIASNLDTAETTQAQGVTTFNSNGFTVGTLAKLNTNTATYAAWCWDAGSSTVTNTAGTIQSSVRANTSAGFSIVTYTGTGASATVGHGLGVAPQMIIVKNRNATADWPVQHMSAGTGRLLLNTTTGYSTAALFQNQAPTSTVFSVGSASTNSPGNAADMVAYCFAPVTGYSAFGSYAGNGNADGPFVYTGFRPRWILLKRTDGTTYGWTIIDTARLGYNVDNNPLYPNLPDAEGATDLADILSNGFKLQTSNASVNASATYVYAAFAEFPFQYARAR